MVVAILVKVKMPGGPAFFCQKRVGKDGKLFTCHKFRTMVVAHNGSSVSVSGDSRITPLGAKLRHWKLDELPELWAIGVFTALTECQSGPTKGRKSPLSTEGPEAADRQYELCGPAAGCARLCR